MLAKYFLWVWLCAGPYCHCERVTFGASDRELYLKSSLGELHLTKVNQRGDFYIMRQDTSYFAVIGEKKNGLIVFINHLTKSGKVDRTISIQLDSNCVPRDL